MYYYQMMVLLLLLLLLFSMHLLTALLHLLPHLAMQNIPFGGSCGIPCQDGFRGQATARCSRQGGKGWAVSGSCVALGTPSVPVNLKVAIALAGSGKCVPASQAAASNALQQYLNTSGAQNVVVRAASVDYNPAGGRRTLLGKEVSAMICAALLAAGHSLRHFTAAARPV
jgi:hypothetical protein